MTPPCPTLHPSLPPLRTMTRLNTKFTPEEAAAFKAKNRARKPQVVTPWATPNPVRKTQRQEWQELLLETEDMIRAANRQGHWQLLPALLQRHETFTAMVANRAIA